ncbi:MAG: RNA polymerase sigma-70 factor [Bacteroidales bacterium]|jgi:RNA polymerase sigma-70 factor (ECF subfamily)|nr:RNA polymerase sigma-70 factor [Bacteroidales bacterium]
MSSHKGVDVKKLQSGDKREFELMFKSYYPYLCFYAESIVGEKCAAEEIMSDFFLRLWENHKSIVINKSLQAYLMKGVRNNCLKHLEHMKVHQKHKEHVQYLMENSDLLLPQSGEHPLSLLITRESLEEIEKAIDLLPPQCKEVFTLIRMDNLSYEETSKKLGISINTVRTQIVRAMRKLKESINI